jgi:hypothetical protein
MLHSNARVHQTVQCGKICFARAKLKSNNTYGKMEISFQEARVDFVRSHYSESAIVEQKLDALRHRIKPKFIHFFAEN